MELKELLQLTSLNKAVRTFATQNNRINLVEELQKLENWKVIQQRNASYGSYYLFRDKSNNFISIYTGKDKMFDTIIINENVI